MYLPLNGDVENPYMSKLKDFQDTYKTSQEKIIPNNPNGYSALISAFISIVEKEAKSNKNLYKIMFIISPADVTDNEEVKKLLIKASALPLSIVFVECHKEALEKLRTLVNKPPVSYPILRKFPNFPLVRRQKSW